MSVVSLGEARIKQSLGNLELPETFRADIAEQGFRELAVLGEHTDELVRLPSHHRDPFDRLLIAQARGAGMTLVTADENIARYDVSKMNGHARARGATSSPAEASEGTQAQRLYRTLARDVIAIARPSLRREWTDVHATRPVAPRSPLPPPRAAWAAREYGVGGDSRAQRG